MPRLEGLIAVLLLASACTPKSEPKLDGAPAETPGTSGPAVDDGGLAGAPTAPASSGDVVLPGVLDVALPAGALAVKDCEKIVAPDYNKPPSMTCVALTGMGALPIKADNAVEGRFLNALQAAGWKPVRTLGAERYFERPRGQTDCADVAVLTVLEGKALAAVIKAASAPPPPADLTWRAYSIPASTHEACGADRMKP